MQRHRRVLPVLAAFMGLVIPACGGGGDRFANDPDAFKSGLEESIKAAEKGKELMKDARAKR